MFNELKVDHQRVDSLQQLVNSLIITRDTYC